MELQLLDMPSLHGFHAFCELLQGSKISQDPQCTQARGITNVLQLSFQPEQVQTDQITQSSAVKE